jgi:hypothetical protein
LSWCIPAIALLRRAERCAPPAGKKERDDERHDNGFGLNLTPSAFSFSLDGAAAQPFSNSGVSCTSGAVCKHLELQVGSQHTVTETPPIGWGATFNNCTNVAIVAAQTQTCTITNSATQNNVFAVTKQRVLLYDRATLSTVRRMASNEPAMQVTFTIYQDSATCSAQSGGLGSEVVSVTFPNATDTSITVGTSSLGYEIKLDTTGNQDVTTARFWRAVFHQNGTNPPNADFTTPCNEITTVRFQH